MRVNNVSVDTSIQSLLVVLFLIPCSIFIGIIIQTEGFSTDSTLELLLVIFLIFISPLILLVWFVELINKRCAALSLMDIIYVDFGDSRIGFCFKNPKYNISCGYSDIENLEMEIHTNVFHDKHGTHTRVSEIELHFTLLNGKHFSLHNTPLNKGKYIYKLLHYMRAVKSFSYKFSGDVSADGEDVVNDIKERIEDYRKTGCKQILSTPQENVNKWLSILSFAVGVYALWEFSPLIIAIPQAMNIASLAAVGPFLLFSLAAFVIDGFLIVDKINDRKFNIYHKSDEFISKIPCELITGIQLLILVVVIILRYCF